MLWVVAIYLEGIIYLFRMIIILNIDFEFYIKGASYHPAGARCPVGASYPML